MADAPLNCFVVVDLSTGIPGAYCTKLLSDGGGADVIKVEAPEGDPLRRWSASGAQIGPDEDGALFSFLAGGKQSVVATRRPTARSWMICSPRPTLWSGRPVHPPWETNWHRPLCAMRTRT